MERRKEKNILSLFLAVQVGLSLLEYCSILYGVNCPLLKIFSYDFVQVIELFFLCAKAGGKLSYAFSLIHNLASVINTKGIE